MPKSLIVNKPQGVTPLQVINKLKTVYPEYQYEKISYAGRLDPMADGVLVLLIGDENKKRSEYENMDKEYEFEVLFGISTDTSDTLGIIDGYLRTDGKEIEKLAQAVLAELTGKQKQAFPAYSSKPVNGKPLYWWARNNKLSEIEIPQREIEIKKIEHLETFRINKSNLQEEILNRIKNVQGDFRQNEIIASWNTFFSKCADDCFYVMRFKAEVSSGTYIRVLAKKIGAMIGVPSIAYSIKRTRVGEFRLDYCLKLD